MTGEERDGIADAWMAALEARHLADLRLSEVARALRALSSAYVERRTRLARGAALDGAGKRAAFALYYGPLHFLLTSHIARALGAVPALPGSIVDLGCGTGVVGAAWAGACGAGRPVLGLDRHPWAVTESNWTYRALGTDGHARHADVSRLALRRDPAAVSAAFILNELAPAAREGVLNQLVAWAGRGTAVLVIEPIARGVAPWMDAWAPVVERAGGRRDEWRVAVEPPDVVRRLGRAAGLACDELTARSLYWPSGPSRRPGSE